MFITGTHVHIGDMYMTSYASPLSPFFMKALAGLGTQQIPIKTSCEAMIIKSRFRT